MIIQDMFLLLKTRDAHNSIQSRTTDECKKKARS